jgi:hypothetical protein
VELDIPAEQKAGLRDKFAALFQGMLAPPIRLPGTRCGNQRGVSGVLVCTRGVRKQALLLRHNGTPLC